MKCRYWFVLILLLGGLAHLRPAVAQTQPPSPVDEQLRRALARGVKAIQEQNQRRARRLLEGALMDTLSFVSPEHGAGAYWLGRAYLDDGRVNEALSVWRSGLLSLRAQDRFSVRLADAFIHHVYARKKETEYTLATDAYQKMLKSIGDSSHTRDERERIARRLRQLALVLPDEVRARAGLPASDSAITWKVVPSVRGAELLAWWRSEDPLPGTRANELLRDHLRRVAHARTEFDHPNTVYGFDERGEIYVRLGPPDHNVSVSYTSDRLTDLIYEREVGVDVRLSEFPANEFWSYGDVDRRLYYIFVREEPGGPFTIGTVEDLLPSSLRGAFGSSRRAQQRSVYALAVLRSIYRTFGPFHPDMARRYDEVANYLQYVRSGGLEQFPNTSDRSPSVFLNRTLSQHSNEDAIAARKRRKRAPRQLSTAKQRWERLPIAVRTARFLNDDGTTRTEVYWAPRAGAFVPGKKQRETLEEKGYTEFDDVLVEFTATQETAAYRDRVINRKNYRLTNVGGNESTIPAQTFSTQRGDSTLYHLGLQWDAYLFNAAKQRVGPKLKVATRRRDSLRALSNDPDQLEMSDLRPVVLPEEAVPRPKNARPYPFETVTLGTPIALYFEIYHLSLGDDGRTTYTVEYRVEGQADRGAIAAFFLGKETRETVVSSTYEGTSRTSKELIRLDVGNWNLKTKTTATVTVRVIEKATGQQVERSIQFQLIPPSQ